MTDLVPHSPNLPARRDPRPVHQAVHDQLVKDIGDERIKALQAVVDAKTFNASLHWLSGAKRSAETTKHRYIEDLTAFAWWVGEHHGEHHGEHPVALLDVLDFDTVTVWTVWARSQGMAVRSRRRILAAVSSLFGKTAVPQGWAAANPVSFDYHAPTIGTEDNGRPAGATRVLPFDDAVRMVTACETDEEHLVMFLLFELAMREHEVTLVRAENIDRNTSPAVLTFRRKGGQWAKRQIPAEMQRHLDAVLGGRDNGPLLLHPETGEPVNRHYLINITRRLARRAKIPNPKSVVPHTLRAAAGTDHLESDVPLQEVQKWMDHKHPSTTLGYWERSNALRKDAALTSSLMSRVATRAAQFENETEPASEEG